MSIGGGRAALWSSVQLGADLYGIDGGHAALALPSAPNAAPSVVLPNAAYYGAGLAQTIQALVAQGSHVTVLSRITLGGVAVDPLQAVGVLGRPGLRVTFSFNAGTHVLQGFDAASNDASYVAPAWKVRLQSSAVVPAAAVPAGTFALDVPRGARILASADSMTLPAACGQISLGGHDPSSANGSSAKGTPAPSGSSLLLTCRRGDPLVTVDDIVTALLARPKAQIQAAADAGVLTATAAAAAVDTLPAELALLVTGQPSGLG